MATLNEITYNIKNIVEGGVVSDDSNVSTRQIKYMIHAKRAELLLKYTDSGRKTSESLYQIDKKQVYQAGILYNRVVGFNNNRAIRSIAYREDNSIDASMELLPVVQDHDRMFIQQSKFMRNVAKKHASLTPDKLYVFEGDSIVSGGIIEMKAIFENPTQVSSYVDDDTTQYPISNELLSVLTQEIIGKEIVMLYNLSANTPNNQTDDKTKSKKVQK
tara:strand:- start:4460 stop:5110 length:651 start_codon:yes stop_codon:yes gene_type:complete